MNPTARASIIGLIFLALLGVLTLRLWSMQVTDAQAYEDRAERNQVRIVYTPAPRGDIFDINGVKLAGTRSALAAVVDLALVESEDIETLSRNLAAFLDSNATAISDSLTEANAPQVTVAVDLTEYEATFIVEHREMFPGVNIIPQPVRVYPQGEIAAHVVGYIGRPNETDIERPNVKGTTFVGKAGVERFYDDQLLGTEGLVQYQVDAKRKVLSLAGEEAPTAGGSLVLTIDSELQRQLQDSLRDGLALARRDEMEERERELARQSISDRLAEAQVDAEAAALEEANAAAESEEQPATEPGVDDDDVSIAAPPVEIDSFDVLASLHPSLPIDSNGVCVPVQRVNIPLDGDAVLSGIDPRFIRLESVSETDGELTATVSIGSERVTVKQNQSFGGTLQVLAIEDDEVILYHRDKWCPVRSVGVVTDPTDGSVLAMSSYPTFDPSAFVDGLSDDQWAELSTASAFQNFAVQGLYAPASTFKTVPYILAMEEGFYALDRGLGDKELTGDAESDTAPIPLKSHTDPYNCSGEFRFELNDGTTQVKRDWLSSGHGPLDLHGALVESCDLYFWDIALRLWEERGDDSGVDKENLLQEYAREYGFGEATGVDLPFERDGLVPDRAWFQAEQRESTGRVRPDGPWVGGDLMDIAVGQGAMLTTPLQMANGYAAMVNGGTLFQPKVVSHIVDSDGNTVQEVPTTVVREIDISPSTVQWLRADLQRVVNDLGSADLYGGTGKSAFYDRSGNNTFGPGVELVGGKTGTGEVIKAPRTERFRQVDNAWFIGIAPINNPKYVVAVVVERGGSGGRVAAPVARQVLQYLMNGPEGVTELAPGLDAD
jgi:cell division protein FtsI/penicillin-binding protein 2